MLAQSKLEQPNIENEKTWMEKPTPARAQIRLEDLLKNLVKPIWYNYVEFILAGKKSR